VFVAGAGGLGCASVAYLAAAGVGCIRLCDRGRVERSNLNRQFFYSDDDVGEVKVRIAAQRIRVINPQVQVVALNEQIEPESVSALVSDAHVIVDCLDNFATRYVINEFVIERSVPFVHAGVYGMAGQITFIHPPHTPCLRCIFPEAPGQELFPIIGATTGVIGSLEALETLKFLTRVGQLLMNRLLIFEGDLGSFEEVSVMRNPACPACGEHSARARGDLK
jgi:molybdopterin/thiamine biosynthesis adenylyltransferase